MKSIKEILYRTKACENALQGKLCLHPKCDFAHSIKELRLPECGYGGNCKKHDCKFFHPYETVDNYHARINYTPPEFPIIKQATFSDEDDVEVLIDGPIDTTHTTFYHYKPLDLNEPIIIEKNNEFCDTWAMIAVIQRRSIKFV